MKSDILGGMIHLASPETDKSFCGHFGRNDILTHETPPHNREVFKLCQECKYLFSLKIGDERRKAQEAWNNRPSDQKFHDWLEGWAHFGESDMGVIGDGLAVLATCGLVYIPKYLAKYLLKAGL